MFLLFIHFIIFTYIMNTVVQEIFYLLKLLNLLKIVVDIIRLIV